MVSAKQLTAALLEDNYDQHVKAYDRVNKWDKAHSSFKDLMQLKHKSMALMHDMGHAISYERALAHLGLSRDDVERPIRGAEVSAVHNYKKTMPAKVCRSPYCGLVGQRQPESSEVCRSCQEPLKLEQVRIPPSTLRDKLASHIVGAKLNDGRYVWFDEPVARRTDPVAEKSSVAKPAPPQSEADKAQQRRLGKWW